MADATLTMSLETQAELPEEDRGLVAAARKDPHAAGRLFDKYYGEILRYVDHCLQDHAAAEDLTSNVFFRAFQRLGLFRWRRIPFRAWLYRIASNEVRMHYRREKRRLAFQANAPDSALAREATSAGAEAEALDDRRLLHRALMDLDQKYRTVIVLRYLEDKTLAEICSITHKREGTIKSQLHRGLSQLKQALARAGVSLS